MEAADSASPTMREIEQDCYSDDFSEAEEGKLGHVYSRVHAARTDCLFCMHATCRRMYVAYMHIGKCDLVACNRV